MKSQTQVTMKQQTEHNITEKKKSALDAEFVEHEKVPENPKNATYIQMFGYASRLEKFLMVLGLLSAIITGLLQPINNILFGKLTGDVIDYAMSMQVDLPPDQRNAVEEKFVDNVLRYVITNSLFGASILICSYTSTATFNYAAMKQTFRIRAAYLKAILNQDVGWYDVNETGDFASKMSDDLYKFEDGMGEKIPAVLEFVVMVLGSFALAFIKGWELALVCLVSLPATMIVIVIVAMLTTKLAKHEMKAYGVAGSIAEEVLSLIRTVTAFGGQEKEIDRYNKNLIFARKNNIRKSMFGAIGWGLLWLIVYSSNALAFWYGVKLVLRDRGLPDAVYTPSNMIAIFLSVMMGSTLFGAVSPYIETLGSSKAAATNIFRIINQAPTINMSKGEGETLDSLKGNVQFKSVYFRYPSRKDTTILQGLNLNIKFGETVALVGSSGCGKSTVIQLIQRLYDVDSGEVLIDGKNIKDFDLTWLRNQIGVVGQEPVLFGTTIIENIKYGKDGATEEEVIEAAKKANAHNFIKMLPDGYYTLVGEKGAKLSGGQKQRIAIARALVRSPTLLLLDEATSALDNTSEAKVQTALDAACVECTTIIVAHRLSTIRRANKIVVLSNGSVVEEGTHEKLMALKKEYYRLVTTQVKSTESLEASQKNKLEDSIDTENEILENTENNTELEDGEEEDDFLCDKNVSVLEIVKMNAPEWPYIVLAGLASMIVGCGMPIFAILFGSIIGALSYGDPDVVRSETDTYCMYFAILGVVTMISVFIQVFCLGIAGEKMTERVRSLLFKTMIHREIGFFDKKSNGVGSLCSKLSTDAADIQGATGQRVGGILQAIATFFLAIGLSLYYEWKLALATATFTPLLLITIFLEKRNTSGQNDSRDKALQKSAKIAVEAIGNIRTVASLSLEDKFQHIYVSELIPYYTSSLRAVHWRAIVFSMAKSIPFFVYAVVIYYGSFLIRDGLPYDRVFQVLQAQVFGTITFASSLAFAPNVAKGVNAAKKVKTFLSRIPAIRDHVYAQNIEKVTGNFKLNKIEFSYPTRPNALILKGLDLNALTGKTVALVGESGCGKSTVIHLIERLYDPKSGEVQLDDVNIKDISLASLRSHMGIISQEPNLFNKSIAENIAYGDNSREVTMDEIIQAAKNANIHNFVAGMPQGYDTKLGEKAVQLSGGQKQRIAIARALVRNPKVLLLDEATSALDTESEKVVQEALDQAKKGRTCITIAHRLTTIQDADLICVVKNGIIAESGTHRELLQKNELYYKLYTQKK